MAIVDKIRSSDYRTTKADNLCSLLIASIKDEDMASSEYDEIIKLMPKSHIEHRKMQEHLKMLESIRDNEAEHYLKLRTMAKDMGCKVVIDKTTDHNDGNMTKKLVTLAVLAPIIPP